MVWLKVQRTGAVWEMPEEKARELIRWYKDEYAIVPAPASADAPATPTLEPEKAPPAVEEPAADAPKRSRKEK
jgi:hypothetical protein